MDYALFNSVTPNFEVTANSVWDQHHSYPGQFQDSHAFECPLCHQPLLLAGLDSQFPKRVYFRTLPHKGHVPGCLAETMSYEEYRDYRCQSLPENESLTADPSMEIIFKQQNRTNIVRPTNDSTNNGTPVKIGAKSAKSYPSAEEYHQRRRTSFSLHRIQLEIQHATEAKKDWKKIRVKMEWPQLDNNDQIVSYVKDLSKATTLNDVIFNANSGKIPTLNQIYVFRGLATIDKESTKYGEQYFIHFINSHLTAHWTERTLKGLTHVKLIRDAAKSHNSQQVKIMLCGYFYKKAGSLIFNKRTKYVSDFITIVD